MIPKVRQASSEEIDLKIHVGEVQFSIRVLKESTIGSVIDLIRNTPIHEKNGP